MFRYLKSIIKKIFFRITFGDKYFSHSVNYRSFSDNGRYINEVSRILSNKHLFINFKRSKIYNEILEHVDFNLGAKYLNILKKRNDNFISKGLNSVLLSDDIGNPVKYFYKDINVPLSPTTLRYLKVASDLNGLFGNNLRNTAEIGCGYGGQAKVNDKLLKVNLQTLFDLPVVNNLIDKYLNIDLFNGAYQTTVINKTLLCAYDLVISNYGFSELPSELQKIYLKKVITKCKKGYLTMNSGLGGTFSKGTMLLSQIKNFLPKFEIFEEDPVSNKYNYIIVCGHNRKFSNKFMKKKL
jgi:putative sugar O-methyltransferase